MTERFTDFMPFILKWEGTVYENDPDDLGGATKYGIDQRSHPKENIRELTKERAYEIYSDEYWTRNKCGNMPQWLGEVFFNACVNCGRGRADKLLELSSGNPIKFLDAQDAFYRRLAEARPRSAKFLKGWLNRTNDLRRWIS